MRSLDLSDAAPRGCELVFVLFPCCSCGRRGSYLVPGQPVVRCKYCRWMRRLNDQERDALASQLAEVARERREQAGRHAGALATDRVLVSMASGA